MMQVNETISKTDQRAARSMVRLTEQIMKAWDRIHDLQCRFLNDVDRMSDAAKAEFAELAGYELDSTTFGDLGA